MMRKEMMTTNTMIEERKNRKKENKNYHCNMCISRKSKKGR